MADRLPNQISEGSLELRLWRPDDVQQLHRAVVENIEHLRPWMAWISYEPLTIGQRLELIAEWQSSWEKGEAAPMAMLCEGQVVGGTG